MKPSVFLHEVRTLCENALIVPNLSKEDFMEAISYAYDKALEVKLEEKQRKAETDKHFRSLVDRYLKTN
jgi:hypothetical protein